MQSQQNALNPVTGQILGKGIMPPQAPDNRVTQDQFSGQTKARPEVLAYYRNNMGGQQGSQNPTAEQNAAGGEGQQHPASHGDKSKHKKAVRMARTRIEAASRERRDEQKETGQSRTPAS